MQIVKNEIYNLQICTNKCKMKVLGKVQISFWWWSWGNEPKLAMASSTCERFAVCGSPNLQTLFSLAE